MNNDKEQIIELVKYALSVTEKEYYQICYEIHLIEHDISYNPIESEPLDALNKLINIHDKNKDEFTNSLLFFKKTNEYLHSKKEQINYYKNALFELLKKLINDQIVATKYLCNVTQRQIRIALSSIGFNVWEQYFPYINGWWSMQELKKPEH